MRRIVPVTRYRRHREELERRQAVGEALRNFRIFRAISVQCDRLLRGIGKQKFQECASVALAVVPLDVCIDPRNVRFGKDADRWINDLQIVACVRCFT
jgi:hypothetical protein